MYKLSILIPVYNVENYIEKCLRSVLTNTIIANCEVIIVNDCSPDSSVQIIKRVIDDDFPNLRNNIKIINNQTNLGISNTRNVLMENASGEYIIFVDSDDWVEPEFFEKMYNKSKENNADLTGCNLINEYENGTSKNRQVIIPSTGYECIASWMHGNLPSWLWIKCIRRELIVENNLKFEPNLDYNEDSLFMIQVFYYAKVLEHLDEYLYHYSRRGNSISGGIRSYKKATCIVNSMNKIESFLKAKYDIENKLFDYFDISKIEKKSWVVMTGTKKAQKAYVNLWPEINLSVDKMDVSRIRKTILKNENFMAILLLKLLVIKKILRKEYSIKQYLEK